MFKKLLYFLIIVAFLGVFSFASAEVTSPTGIIPGALWYSKETPVAGETIKIYIALWNGEKEPLQAKVEFYDKNIILGEREVSLTSEMLKEISIPWKVTSGDHVISAKIVSSKINGVNIILENNETDKKRIFVPVLVGEENGVKNTTEGAIKNQLTKTGIEIKSFLPSSVSEKFNQAFRGLDNFRNDLLSKITVAKEKAKEELKLINSGESTGDDSSVKKPMTEIKVFSFHALSYILQSKILFYTILIIIAFFIIRAIFRAIFR